MKNRLSLLSSLLAVAALAACRPAGTPEPTAAPVTVRVAVLPILDTLPMHVAVSQGYFAAENVILEFVPVASAAERDQLMQAGQADAMINDIVSTMFYNKDAVNIVVVRFARTATPEFPQFFILAGKDSGITDVAGLRGVEVAISDATVIDYLTDRLLQAEGLTAGDIKTIAVPRIPDRLAALADGTVKAATIPDPAAAAAMAGGARIIVTDAAHPEYGNSLLSFSAAFVKDHPETVKGILAAWEKAVTDINADKTRWNDVLLNNNLLAEQLIGRYTLPDYPTASVPTEAQFSDVNEWAKENSLVSVDVSYSNSVNATFLP